MKYSLLGLPFFHSWLPEKRDCLDRLRSDCIGRVLLPLSTKLCDLGKSPNLSVPQFSHLSKVDNGCTYLPVLLWALNPWIHVAWLKQCLPYAKCSINVTCCCYSSVLINVWTHNFVKDYQRGVGAVSLKLMFRVSLRIFTESCNSKPWRTPRH